MSSGTAGRGPAPGRQASGVVRLAAGTLVCAIAYAVLVGLGDGNRSRGVPVIGVGVLWVVFVATTWWVRRGGASWRRPVLAVVLAATVVQIPGVLVPPRTSNDAYRYVWDGRVQLSGTSPYRYAPLDDRLAALRDPVLFPLLGPSTPSGYLTEPLPHDRDALLARAAGDPRTWINRPLVPTIYPPVAQVWFTLVAWVTPWSLGTLGVQLGAALLAVALAGALAAWRRRRGGDASEALWWAWCPTVVIETGNGAHLDVLAAALMVAAVVVFTTPWGRRRAAWVAGLLVGLAASVKLTPLAILPALMPLRHKGFRAGLPAPLAAIVTLAVTYLPHVLAVGMLVLGYLPGYLLEEGSDRAGVLALVLPRAWLPVAVGLVLLATAAWAVLRVGRSVDVATAALVLYGMLLLTTTPSYPWYAVPVVALAVLTGRREWLAVAAACYVAYGGPGIVGYVVAALLVLVVGLARAGRLPGLPPGRRLGRSVDNHAGAPTPGATLER